MTRGGRARKLARCNLALHRPSQDAAPTGHPAPLDAAILVSPRSDLRRPQAPWRHLAIAGDLTDSPDLHLFQERRIRRFTEHRADARAAPTSPPSTIEVTTPSTRWPSR